MDEELRKLFKGAIYQSSNRLSEDIWQVIKNKNSRNVRIKKFGYLSLSILSLSGCVFSLESLIEQSIQLGFLDYASLVFSDGLAVFKYWKELSLSLVHSLPAMNFIFTLALIFILFSSVRNLSYQFKNKLIYG